MCKPLIKATSCFVLNFNIVIDIDPPIISVLKSVLKFDNHLILHFKTLLLTIPHFLALGLGWNQERVNVGQNNEGQCKN